MSSRTTNSIRNSAMALFAQILSIILSFVTRTIFINILGSEYLGINGLFSNILSMLSFAELGVGTAIVYAMYKPLAENDEKKISALMNLYEKTYRIIGLTIAVAGIILVPFLDYLIKDKPNISYLSLIYLMFLANSVISYFFAYKRSILIANQNAYINTINQMVYFIIQNLIQIIILFFYQRYILFLAMQIIFTVLSNVSISKKVDQMYPYLKLYRNEITDKKTKNSIKKNVVGTMSSRLGSIVVTGTDNLLISAFIGISWVGVYSNYVLIVSTITSLIMQLLNAITASVGNLVATEDSEKAYDIFKKIFFINFLLTEFCSIFFIVLLNPFISIWIGKEYLLNYEIVALIVINFFIIQMRRPAIIFIDTYGLYWEIKWKSIIEATINLIASLVLIKFVKLGITGVLLGTCISNLLTNLWWEPYTAYKYGFKKSLTKYFSIYIKYLSTGLFTLALTIFLTSKISLVGIWELAIKAILSLIIFSLIMLVSFYKTNEFKFSINLLKKLLLRKVRT